MSKKNIFLILIVSIFLSILAISVWGKNAEISGKVPASQITLYDENKQEITKERPNTDGQYKVVEIKEDKTKSITYTFSALLGPENTTDPDLYVYFDNIKVESAPSLNEVNIEEHKKIVDEKEVHTLEYDYEITFSETQQVLTILRFEFNTKDVKHRQYLVFTFTEGGSEIIDD